MSLIDVAKCRLMCVDGVWLVYLFGYVVWSGGEGESYVF